MHQRAGIDEHMGTDGDVVHDRRVHAKKCVGADLDAAADRSTGRKMAVRRQPRPLADSRGSIEIAEGTDVVSISIQRPQALWPWGRLWRWARSAILDAESLGTHSRPIAHFHRRHAVPADCRNRWRVSAARASAPGKPAAQGNSGCRPSTARPQCRAGWFHIVDKAENFYARRPIRQVPVHLPPEGAAAIDQDRLYHDGDPTRPTRYRRIASLPL